MDFDTTQLYYSRQQVHRTDVGGDVGGAGGRNMDLMNHDLVDENLINTDIIDENNKVILPAVRRHFREFLRKLVFSVLFFFLLFCQCC